MTGGGASVRGTVQPSDGIAIGVVAYGVTAGVYNSLDVPDRLLVFIFVLTWLAAAARRLMDFRHGRCAAHKVDSSNIVAMIAMMILGTVPWFAINHLRTLSPDSLLWTPVELPTSLAAVGVILAVTSLGWPFIRPAGFQRSGPAFASVTIESVTLNVAMFLLSGSLVIGSLAGLWLALTLRRNIGTASQSDLETLSINASRALTEETSTV